MNWSSLHGPGFKVATGPGLHLSPFAAETMHWAEGLELRVSEGTLVRPHTWVLPGARLQPTGWYAQPARSVQWTISQHIKLLHEGRILTPKQQSLVEATCHGAAVSRASF